MFPPNFGNLGLLGGQPLMHAGQMPSLGMPVWGSNPTFGQMPAQMLGGMPYHGTMQMPSNGQGIEQMPGAPIPTHGTMRYPLAVQMAPQINLAALGGPGSGVGIDSYSPHVGNQLEITRPQIAPQMGSQMRQSGFRAY